MYVQKIFEQSDTEIKHELMCRYSLGSLVVTTPDGLEANSIPFEVETKKGEFGTLRCHLVRSHPLWKCLTDGQEAMVIFQGPNAYISPRWYVAGQKSKKVLPSWNFAVVHAYGKLRIFDDKVWLLNHLEALTAQNERYQAQPWRLAEASTEFVSQSVGVIMGIEIPLTRVLGKWFASQHRTPADRTSLINALQASSNDISASMAEIIQQVDQQNKIAG